MYTASDLMNSPVITISPDATLGEAGELFSKHNISGMPVVDSEGQLCGMISELDEAKQFMKAAVIFSGLPVVNDDGITVGHLSEEDELNELVADAASQKVSDSMTTNVVSANVDDCIVEIIDRFVSRAVHRLPVVDEGRVVGVIGVRDVVNFVRRMTKRSDG